MSAFSFMFKNRFCGTPFFQQKLKILFMRNRTRPFCFDIELPTSDCEFSQWYLVLDISKNDSLIPAVGWTTTTDQRIVGGNTLGQGVCLGGADDRKNWRSSTAWSAAHPTFSICTTCSRNVEHVVTDYCCTCNVHVVHAHRSSEQCIDSANCFCFPQPFLQVLNPNDGMHSEIRFLNIVLNCKPIYLILWSFYNFILIIAKIATINFFVLVPKAFLGDSAPIIWFLKTTFICPSPNKGFV